ncbi:MAG: DHH family phosphoesterase [Myxococcota bacterium]
MRTICEQARVLVTADCGITAASEIQIACDLGVDVIVVDHHTAPDVLPPSLANLDPVRPDCPYPYKGLCATGVAFMLVCALRRLLRDEGYFRERPEPDVRNLLDVVAVATVADMVPMTGANRDTGGFAGLRQMAHSRRAGMRALFIFPR